MLLGCLPHGIRQTSLRQMLRLNDHQFDESMRVLESMSFFELKSDSILARSYLLHYV